jgi:phenylalanyl-tRNA synthetase alpha subunit
MSSQVNSILDNIIEKGSNLTEQAIHKAQELGEIVQDHIEDVSHKVASNEHVQDAIVKANEMKENVQDKMDDVITKADEIKDNAEDQFHNVTEKVMQNEHVLNAVHKTQDTAEAIKDKFHDSVFTPETVDVDAVNAILGKTVGDVTILNTEEQVLAFPGEVVTQELIESARANKVLDVLIANVV